MRAALATVALLALGLFAAGAAARLPTKAPLATVSSTLETRSVVSRLDPLTLAPRGPSVELEEYHGGWSFSPDGRRIAFGKSPAGGNSRDGIRVVDVAQVKLVATVRTDIFVGPLAWLAPHSLVGLLAGNRPALFDPSTGGIVERPLRGGGCDFPPTASTHRALVGVTGRGLFTIDARGRVDITPLRVGNCRGTGLAVEGNSAWVLPAGGRRLAEVDLRSHKVVWHGLRGKASPARYSNELLALGSGRLALAHQSATGPKGVELIDTRFGGRRLVARRDGGVRLAAHTVIAFGAGVSGFSPDGAVRFRLLRGERISNVEVEGAFAYAIGPRGVAVIDLRAGKVVHRTVGAARDVEIQFLHR
jgi:hypothetical protein